MRWGAAAFLGPVLAAGVGDTLVWVNHDAVPHTATREDGAWDSGAIVPGGTWIRVVVASDTGAYFCTYHPGMRGRVDGE